MLIGFMSRPLSVSKNRKLRSLYPLLTGIIAAASFAGTHAIHAGPQPQLIKSDGIENFYRLSDSIYSGSSPENEPAFVELQKHGIKTIISVDGAKPEVEMAKNFGLRYVH